MLLHTLHRQANSEVHTPASREAMLHVYTARCNFLLLPLLWSLSLVFYEAWQVLQIIVKGSLTPYRIVSDFY